MTETTETPVQEATEQAPIEPTEPEAPAEQPAEAPPAEAPAIDPPAPTPTKVPVSAIPALPDIETHLNDKEKLADQLDAGDITFEQYAKKVAGVDRKIAQAQREMVRPVVAAQQAAESARQYWSGWGSGQDVANLQYGKTIPQAKAKAIYHQTAEAVLANPRYQRAEYQNDPARLQAIIDDKWIDALGEEAKKKPTTPAKPQQSAARVSGSSVSASAPSGGHKTAKEKLESGEYDDQLRRF